MNVYRELLDWSQGLPQWQRDALRRIVTQDGLTDDDLQALAALCLAEVVGVPEGMEPLKEEDLPLAAGADSTVTITSVGDVQSVNALAAGSTLDFSPVGLSVVYGRNGAGKTGYTRIVKHVARARGVKDTVLPNVLDAAATGAVPTAKIKYAVGAEQKELDWRHGDVPPLELGRMSVFDQKCVNVYTDKATETAYLPGGLEHFQALASAAGEVAQRLRGRVSELEANAYEPHAGLRGDTEVGKLMADLLQDEGRTKIDRLGTLSADELKRLKDLQEQLAVMARDDPNKVVAQGRLTATRMGALAERIKQWNQYLSPEALERLKSYRDSYETHNQALEELKSVSVEGALPGTGGTVWQTLWAAAKEFSAVAYHEHDFPHDEGEAKCVLCQQPLGTEAKTRMGQFKELAAGKLKEAADLAKKTITDTTLRLDALKPLQAGDTELFQELNLSDEGLGDIMAAAQSQADLRLDVAKAQLDLSKPPSEVSDAIELMEGAVELLETAAAAQRKKADELEAAARDTRKLDELKLEAAELKARVDLSEVLPVVRKEHDRLSELVGLRKALSSCDTSGITRKQTELTRGVVTPTLIAAFNQELKALGVRKKVALVSAPSQRGAAYHRLELQGATTNLGMSAILSEGEQRVAALSAFLTDIASAEDSSALIFDDPVSSLDAEYRYNVARRLRKEATTRQVVVFTHDLAFLSYLFDSDDGLEVEPHYIEVQSTSAGAGTPSTDLPDIGAGAEARLRGVSNKLRQKKRLYEAGADAEWRSVAWDVADKLRSTWERAVEEFLLNKAIERFRHSIQTQRLSRVRVTEQDVQEVDRAMTKLSGWTPAHDAPAEVQPVVPTPDELEEEAGKLQTWIDGIKARNRS